MSRKTDVYIKSGAAGLMAGGLTFLAVKSMCSHRSLKRMSAAKAFKMIGSLMDSI